MSGSERVPGYRGELSEIEILPEGDPSLPPGPDLAALAEGALGCLAANPDPAHNHDSRFTFLPHLCPPFAPEVTANLFPGIWRERYVRANHMDPVAIGDTEVRCDLAFVLMREMARSETGASVEALVHRRLEGYVRSGSDRSGDDLCWVVPYCSFSPAEGPFAMPWTTAMLLHAEAERFRLTADERHRVLARRLFQGLRRIAAWDTGRAWYPAGGSAFRDGEVAGGSFGGLYPIVISPLVTYAGNCGEPEALAFARAMADGFLADLQPHHQHKADGRVHGHSHTQSHAIRGIAQLGEVTGEWRYLRWARTAYEFFFAAGLDTGWAPELFWHPDHRGHSELCHVADLLEMEAWFARAGEPDLWDRVERTVRNHLIPLRFTLTPEFEAVWRDINHGRTTAELELGMAGLRELEGGFLASSSPVDRLLEVRPGGSHHGSTDYRGRRVWMDMAGCCVPSGMRALHVAWSSVVTRTPGVVLVNLAFDRDAPEASVRTLMPGRGRLEVRAKLAAEYRLRPPAWAPRSSVRALRNAQPVTPAWSGPGCAYVAFAEVHPNETLVLEWPLVRFAQRVAPRVMNNAEEEVGTFEDGQPWTFRWTGSLVTASDPRGEWLPLYG